MLKVKIKVGAIASFPLKSIDKKIYKHIKKKFTFPNPLFYRKEKMGISTGNEPEFYEAFQKEDGIIYFKRGLLNRLKKILKKRGYKVIVIDQTKSFKEINLKSKIKPHKNQIGFIEAAVLAKRGYGIAPPSAGKTVMGLEIISRLKQPGMIVVWSTEHQKQWLQAIEKFLDTKSVGGVGGVFKKPTVGDVNVCMQQSLFREHNRKLFNNKIGTVILDELQSYAADTFEAVLCDIPAANVIGVTASIDRRDGKKFLIQNVMGYKPFFVMSDRDVESRKKCKINLIESKYVFSRYLMTRNYAELLYDMARDRKRNQLIIERAVLKQRQKKLVLILVERKYQALYLRDKFLKLGLRTKLLVGKIPPKEIEDDWKPEWKKFAREYDDDQAFYAIQKLSHKKKLDIIIATAKKGNVGLNIRPIDHVIVTTPTGGNIELFNQQKGRCERDYDEELKSLHGEKPTPECDYIWDKKMDSLENKGLNIKRSFNNVRTINPSKKRKD